MEKMDIKGDEINDEKVVQPADKEGCLRGFAVENNEDVDVEKGPKNADYGKESVDPVFSAAGNRQKCQKDKTA
jgi:hypothetical protein